MSYIASIPYSDANIITATSKPNQMEKKSNYSHGQSSIPENRSHSSKKMRNEKAYYRALKSLLNHGA